MTDIIVKDWWTIRLGDDWIRVIEDVAHYVRITEEPWVTITDIFGSECIIRTKDVSQIFHVNEAILRAAAAHHRWSEKITG